MIRTGTSLYRKMPKSDIIIYNKLMDGSDPAGIPEGDRTVLVLKMGPLQFRVIFGSIDRSRK
jgi:hypothetical protein